MREKILKLILENPLYLRLVATLQRIKVGKVKVGLYDAIVIFVQKMSNDRLTARANAVAFSFTTAIFPAIIFIFTLTPYIQNFFPEVTNEQGKLVNEGKTTLVFLNMETNRPCRAPQELLDVLSVYFQ